jgi:hypothetical protein
VFQKEIAERLLGGKNEVELELALCMDACLMAATFFGATARRPFFVLAAALCACRALLLLLGLLCPLFGVPWTIVYRCRVEP